MVRVKVRIRVRLGLGLGWWTIPVDPICNGWSLYVRRHSIGKIGIRLRTLTKSMPWRQSSVPYYPGFWSHIFRCCILSRPKHSCLFAARLRADWIAYTDGVCCRRLFVRCARTCSSARVTGRTCQTSAFWSAMVTPRSTQLARDLKPTSSRQTTSPCCRSSSTPTITATIWGTSPATHAPTCSYLSTTATWHPSSTRF